MKVLYTQIIAFVTFLLVSVTAKAQDGDYVINNRGDTILCKIKTPALGGDPRYRPANAKQDEYVQITIENIKEYYLSGPQIAFRRIYKDSTGKGAAAEFMRPLERGTISIYLNEVSATRYSGPNNTYSSTSVQWYVTKNSDTATLIKTSGLGIINSSTGERKNILEELLKDKKDVYDKFIKDNKFSAKDIQNIVHLYNTGTELRKH